jgi:hypothetical protein
MKAGGIFGADVDDGAEGEGDGAAKPGLDLTWSGEEKSGLL